MTKPLAKGVDEVEDVALAAEELEEIADVVPVVVPAAVALVPGRKSLGVKEPIIFKWKIVGHSGGVALTLFKSVEREDADAQLERLTRDGYYTHLEIMEATAKVIQPEKPKELRRPAKSKETAKKPTEHAAEPKKGASKSADTKSKSKPGRSAGKKSAGKPDAKSPKVKSSKTAPRKTAKKK